MSEFDVLAARTTGPTEEVGTGVVAARDGARSARQVWVAQPLAERAAVIEATVSLMAGEADVLAATIAEACHRTAVEVWSGEIVPTLDALRWLARDGVEALRPTKLSRAPLQWYVRAARHEVIFEPHGVVGIVTPSNSLMFLAVPQVAAALVAGNGVVWKPAPAGAAVAAHVASIFRRAGLPPGALQIVHGGAEAARDLVIAGVDKLHFTGGTAAGLDLYRLQAVRGRPAVLELSGRHIAIVLDDADPRLAARGIAWGKLVNGGRNCISVQLVLATRGVAPVLLEALREAMAAAPAAALAPEEDRRLDRAGRGRGGGRRPARPRRALARADRRRRSRHARGGRRDPGPAPGSGDDGVRRTRDGVGQRGRSPSLRVHLDLLAHARARPRPPTRRRAGLDQRSAASGSPSRGDAGRPWRGAASAPAAASRG